MLVREGPGPPIGVAVATAVKMKSIKHIKKSKENVDFLNLQRDN